MLMRTREKGAIRPLWLCMGVLACVATGTVVNKCLCGAPADKNKVSVIVRGDMINEISEAPPQKQPRQQDSDPAVNNDKPQELPIEKEPEAPKVVKVPKMVKKLATKDQVKDPARLKPGELKRGFLELTFDTLADWTYELPDMTEGKPSREDPIPAKIKQMAGKKYAIRGFMIPFKVDGEEVTEFLLVRNQFACCFGVVPKMNEWLHVRMEPGKKAPYAVDVPITVYGKLEAAELFEKGVVMSLYRMEASEVEEPPIFR